MTIHYLGFLSRFADVLDLMHLAFNYIEDRVGFFASLKFNEGGLQCWVDYQLWRKQNNRSFQKAIIRANLHLAIFCFQVRILDTN